MSTELTRRAVLRGARNRLGIVRRLHAAGVAPGAVRLSWKAPKSGPRPLGYLVLRNGKPQAGTRATSYVDITALAGERYAYAVRAMGKHRRLGRPCAALVVQVPRAKPTPGGGTTADTQPPTVPTGVIASAQSDTVVRVSWNASTDNVGVAAYVVYRDGQLATWVTASPLTDSGLAAGTTYGYTVAAVDAAGNRSAQSSPAQATTAVGPSVPANMTQAMVDRMFWRCGFGPSAADRQQWVGQPVPALADHLLSTAQSYPVGDNPPTYHGSTTIDPLGSTDEMVIEWLYRMQTATNPLTERLAFFWSRHFAIAGFGDAVPAQWMLNYRALIYSFADLAQYPGASFRQLAYAMTAQNGAMLFFLSGWLNVVGRPNENYAREFMELFTLGVQDAQGNPNYSQTDVAQLARCFTGWQIDQAPTSPTFGQTHFTPSYHDTGTKTVLGQSLSGNAGTAGAGDYQAACDVVLAQPSHAPFLITKLWHEFILAPIPPATLSDLVATYTADPQLLIKPVLRKILTHPLMFESIDEPNLVKSPILYYVGVLRQLDAPMVDYFPRSVLKDMQQVPYDPPNVAGWEGGLSWLNTSTCSARFDMIRDLLYLKYKSTGTGAGDTNASDYIDTGGPGETGQQAYDRAYAAAGQPWLSAQAQQILLAFANDTTQFPANADVFARRRRQYALRAFMVGGPDAQVT
ncbi:MAG: DUF1800 family protein [Actinomycetota bacterium]|nr:DUF1800 family protein [Actinomycetota bacterium]